VNFPEVELNICTSEGRPFFEFFDRPDGSTGMQRHLLASPRLNINATDLVRNTALHWCVIVHRHRTQTHSSVETRVMMCKVLLEAGIDRSLTNNDERTAWEIAFARKEILPAEPDDIEEWIDQALPQVSELFDV
jgi:ankyrin repeat protein